MKKKKKKMNKYHKSNKKSHWKQQGMKFTEEDFEYIYSEYMKATNCDLCDKLFKSTKDRQLDHNHKTGAIRNILCNRCNGLRADNKMTCTNTSGYKNISKYKRKDCKQGFRWVFQVQIGGKTKKIKTSIDLDKVVVFRDKWVKENNYYT